MTLLSYQERRRRLFSNLFRTPRPDDVRLDMYLDASGSDNWHEADNEWHIISCPIVWNSTSWANYREWFDGIGGLHASSKVQPNGLTAQENTRTALSFEVPEFCVTTIAHVPSLRKRERGFSKKNPFSHSDYHWGHLIKSVVNSYARVEYPAPIYRAFINNPGGGPKSFRKISKIFSRELGASFPLEQRVGTDPGIALADAIAWATRRWLLKGEQDQIPSVVWENKESRYSWFCLLDDRPHKVQSLHDVLSICGIKHPPEVMDRADKI